MRIRDRSCRNDLLFVSFLSGISWRLYSSAVIQCISWLTSSRNSSFSLCLVHDFPHYHNLSMHRFIDELFQGQQLSLFDWSRVDEIQWTMMMKCGSNAMAWMQERRSKLIGQTFVREEFQNFNIKWKKSNILCTRNYLNYCDFKKPTKGVLNR